jgi:putative peptidoglycan lipid II flippase
MAEKSNRSQLLKSSFGTALATLASRVLGLLRVSLEARVLGGGEVCSGWHLSIAIPNLFRRLLGEGALGTALIPIVAETEKTKGAEAVRRELGVIFALLGVILAVIVIFLGGGAWLLERATADATGSFGTARMRICLKILPLLMPYTFFICLVGVIGSVLNYSRVFVLPALGSLLLNICLIGGLIALRMLCGNDLGGVRAYLPYLSLLVLASGALQLALMLILLTVYGRFPRWPLKDLRDLGVGKKLFKLALPGMIGGAALQVSFIVDRSLAMLLGPQAVPALTFVDRIVDVPIGIFALSLATVLMATMARSALEGNERLADDLAFGLRHVYFVCMPLAALVVFFHEPMLRLLCRGGNYTESDLAAAHYVAVFYGMGIPFFCSLKVILPAFYARKVMDKPLYCSLAAITVNIVLNLILMHPLKQGGIALATVVSALVNNSLLLWLLRRGGVRLNVREVLPAGLRSLLLAAALGFGCSLIFRLWHGPGYRPWFAELGMFCAAAALFAISYLAAAKLCRAREVGEFLGMLRRRRG